MTETNEQKLDRFFPRRGPCAFCGGDDARHRLFDAIQGSYSAGDTIPALAKNYGVSEEAVEAVLLRKPTESP